MYLQIANKGLAPPESFTILGLSSSRGDESKIGQFGSGSKHGILTCLRFGLNPIIFIGNEELSFFSKPKLFKDKTYNHVFYSYKGEMKETGFCQEFGELDWDSLNMALREFISNAIDSSENGFEDVVLDIVAKPEPIEGFTCIYIQLTPEVQKYYSNIQKYFLHFGKKHEESIIKKDQVSPARIYRKGVFVKEVNHYDNRYSNSLFDYNFGEELKIDETRNLNESQCSSAIAKKIQSSNSAITQVLKALKNGEKFYEGRIPYYNFAYHDETVKNRFKSAFEYLFPNSVVCKSDIEAAYIQKRGKNPVVLPENYAELLEKAGCLVTQQFLSVAEQNNYVLVTDSETRTKARKIQLRVWNWIKKTNMHKNKTLPEFCIFVSPVENSSQLNGFYDKVTNVIGIEQNSIENLQVWLEEMAHYITGASDMTRDFQDYAFKLAAELGKKTIL